MQFKHGHIYDGKEKADIRRTSSSNVYITLGGKHVSTRTRKEIIDIALKSYRTIKLNDNVQLMEIDDTTFLCTNDKITVANMNDIWYYLEDESDLPSLG